MQQRLQAKYDAFIADQRERQQKTQRMKAQG
jgi:hypothetical protein